MPIHFNSAKIRKKYYIDSNNGKVVTWSNDEIQEAYESFDDYFLNKDQIIKLKNYAGENLICINCGAHLGFLYRKEFLDNIKNEISGG